MEQHDIQLAVELAMNLGPDNGRRLLEVLAANAALREFDKACAVRLAMHLIQQHWSGTRPALTSDYGIRTEIRDRLMTTFRMSRSSAYRALDVAFRQLFQSTRQNETSLLNNEASHNAKDKST